MAQRRVQRFSSARPPALVAPTGSEHPIMIARDASRTERRSPARSAITLFDPAVSHLTPRSPRMRRHGNRLRAGPGLADRWRRVHRMKALIGTTLVAAFVLISGSVVGAQVSIGIQIGPPPPPRVVYVAPPPPPGNRNTSGLKDIGIRLSAVTCGMTDVGPGHHAPVPTGWRHGATEGCTGGLLERTSRPVPNMIIDGTPTTIGITTPAKATAMAAAVDIADNSQRRNCCGACGVTHTCSTSLRAPWQSTLDEDSDTRRQELSFGGRASFLLVSSG